MATVAQPARTRIHTVRGGGGLRLHGREWGSEHRRVRANLAAGGPLQSVVGEDDLSVGADYRRVGAAR